MLLSQVLLCLGVNLACPNTPPVLNTLREHVERLGKLFARALEAQVFRRRHELPRNRLYLRERYHPTSGIDPGLRHLDKCVPNLGHRMVKRLADVYLLNYCAILICILWYGSFQREHIA